MINYYQFDVIVQSKAIKNMNLIKIFWNNNINNNLIKKLPKYMMDKQIYKKNKNNN